MNAKILVIKRGGGVSCEHAKRVSKNEDIVVLCEKCSDEFVDLGKTDGTISAGIKRLEFVCRHAFQLIQLPLEEGGVKWVQEGNTLLCGNCAKKEAEVVK